MKSILLLIFCIVAGLGFSQSIIYVNQEATGSGSGLNWEDAMTDFAEAVDLAQAGDVIWVAQGVYKPTGRPHGGDSGNPRTVHFTLKNGVSIYGGFAGNEEVLEERNYEENETILSGHIGDPLDSTDNCLHVFYHPEQSNLDNTAVLDGFTITGGYADGFWPDNSGGGMLNLDNVSPTIRNCLFSGNYGRLGGAVYNLVSEALFINCTFSDNTASDGDSNGSGGAVYNNSGSPQYIECIFQNNHSISSAGAAYCKESYSLFQDCFFSGNTAISSGGAIHTYRDYSTIKCSTFTGNTARSGGAIFSSSGNLSDRSDIQVINSTFTANEAGYRGGAISTVAANNMLVLNSTFYGNLAEDTYHSISNSTSSTTIIHNSILWGEDDNQLGGMPQPQAAYCVIRGGFFPGSNIITQDPELGPLADNGGPTMTHAITRHSSAMAIPRDAGDNDWHGTPELDQRGISRAPTGYRAMGAFEPEYVRTFIEGTYWHLFD